MSFKLKGLTPRTQKVVPSTEPIPRFLVNSCSRWEERNGAIECNFKIEGTHERWEGIPSRRPMILTLMSQVRKIYGEQWTVHKLLSPRNSFKDIFFAFFGAVERFVIILEGEEVH